MITEYVLIFPFNKTCGSVWLITKEKPEWQKGSLNGIGGKIEAGETPMQAAIRELKEESGLKAKVLIPVGEMRGVNNDGSFFAIFIFTLKTSKMLKTMESEPIGEYLVDAVKLYQTIGNVPMLIEACIYKLTGTSHFKYLKMEY